MSDTVEINTKGLDQFIKSLKAPPPVARVGVLADKTMRKNSKHGETSASIGALHEFGSGKMPLRSFLRVPISEHLQSKMENSGRFDKNILNEVIKSGSIKGWVQVVAVLAEGIVSEAFATGGYGKWPAWKNPKYKNDDNKLLVDTRQLRDSITSEVK